MQKLRKLTAGVAVTAIVAAGFPSSPAFAQARVIPTTIETPTAPVDQAALISSTIHGFPNGGEPLKLAISDLIVKHRNLAVSVVTVLRNDPSLTPAQKQAIVAGLADALNRMGIVAADLILKAPAAVPVPVVGGFPWWLLVLAAAGGIAACAAACGNNNNENVFVSHN